ncbi:MAG: galactokinase family protein [Candidatus Korarchaeota archaeon]|nr:GHMP kinase [Thermoproteota archaeon]MCR8463269.1 GHMP kinase [Thermoproteota archaeon]
MKAKDRLLEFLLGEGLKPLKVASAPGRIDFLNTHQDYKGLPVVAIAVNKRIYLAAVEETESVFSIKSLDLEGEPERVFEITDFTPRGQDFSDYIKACIYSLLMATKTPINKGYRIIISSDIPIGSGMGSSGSYEVAFIRLLAELLKIDLPTMMLAEIAFRAENMVMGIPCGRLDQYAAAYGGVMYLKPTWTPTVLRLNKPPFYMIVIDSGIKHKTANIHPQRQEEIRRGVQQLLSLDLPDDLREKLEGDHNAIKWENLKEEDIKPFLQSIDDIPAKRILFTIRMNDLTRIAVKILKDETLNANDLNRLRQLGVYAENPKEILCAIINKQHELLRDLYDVSLPSIERIIEAAFEAGACCAKISGAGLGGSVIAFTDSKDTINEIIQEVLAEGSKAAWCVDVDTGARIEDVWI